MMKYDTIEDGESTPLHAGGYSEDAPSTKNKHTSSIIVRALMVGTVVAVGALLLMAGPSTMTTMNNKSNTVDDMVVVSSNPPTTVCAPATGTFSGLSCKKQADGGVWNICAFPGDKWRYYNWDEKNAENLGIHYDMHHFETCYVSNNQPPNDRCWSRAHTVTSCVDNPQVPAGICNTSYRRCDPVGYNDGDEDYDKDGFWHVQTPLPDGSCGNPCREFKSF